MTKYSTPLIACRQHEAVECSAPRRYKAGGRRRKCIDAFSFALSLDFAHFEQRDFMRESAPLIRSESAPRVFLRFFECESRGRRKPRALKRVCRKCSSTSTKRRGAECAARASDRAVASGRESEHDVELICSHAYIRRGEKMEIQREPTRTRRVARRGARLTTKRTARTQRIGNGRLAGRPFDHSTSSKPLDQERKKLMAHLLLR